MAEIPVKLKMELSELLAKWFKQFGKVSPRRPYHEDSGDGGSSQLLFEGHPLFAELPIGAPSDLDFLIHTNNSNILEAEKRSDEACPELRKQIELAMAQKYRARPSLIGRPTPL